MLGLKAYATTVGLQVCLFETRFWSETHYGAGDMVWLLRTLAALTDDQGSVPSGSQLSHSDPPASTTPVLELKACEATPILKKFLRNKKSGFGGDKVGGTGRKRKREVTGLVNMEMRVLGVVGLRPACKRWLAKHNSA